MNSAYSDEIDLFEIVESLWSEKLLIILVTFLGALLSIVFALAAEPVYEATTTLQEPSSSAIQGYNLWSKAIQGGEGQAVAAIKGYTVIDVYNIFLRNLNSNRLRNMFFEEVYFPSLFVEEQKKPRDNLMAQLNNSLTIKQPNAKKNQYLYEVAVELSDADKAAAWANLYVQKAIALSKQEIADDIHAEIDVRKQSIALKIDNLVRKAQAERQDEIIKLKEALSIAQAIGLENPSLPAGKNTEEGANYVDRNLIYMRGSKALKSQIDVLEARKDDYAFVPELREYNARLNLLN